MASEYSLNLKAVLDTSDVQQKLNQLKQQQQGASGGNGGVGAGGIQQALQRLNTTLTTLQHSIDKLVSSKSTGGHGSGYIPFVAARQALRARPQPAAQWHSRVLTEDQRINADLNPIHSGRAVFDPQRLQYLRNNPTLAALRSPSGQGSLTSGSRMPRQMRANLRMGAGLAFGTIAGGVENYAQATGNQGLATGASFVKNIGYGAATGALVGGPIGAAIGGSVGALNAAFEELARRARDAAKALDEQHQKIFSGQRVDNALSDVIRHRTDRYALARGDKAYFEAELKKAQDLYNKTTEALGKEVGVGGEGIKRFNLREYEKETERLMKLKGKDDKEVIRRQNVATLYTANAAVLKKADARIEEIEEQYLSKIKDKKNTPLNKLRADAAEEQAKSLKEALKSLKAPDLENVNSLASQGFMISANDDEARLDEQTKYLRDLVNLTRQIKDKENEAAVYG